LIDNKGNSVPIICDHYPPVEGKLIDVLAYINPLARLESPLIIQVEVKILESPSFNSKKITNYE